MGLELGLFGQVRRIARNKIASILRGFDFLEVRSNGDLLVRVRHTEVTRARIVGNVLDLTIRA